MIQVVQLTFPPPNTPLIDPKGAMTNQGMSFWRALWNRTGAGTGLTNGVNLAIVGAGASQTTATALTQDWNQLTTSGGVILPALTGGQAVLVANEGGGNANIYPPVGSQIDALGVNSPYVLATLKLQLYSYFSASQIYSLQLG